MLNRDEKRQLAKLLLEWEDAKQLLDAVEDGILFLVLKGKESVTVGNVRAVYSEGRKTYDWEDAALGLTLETLEKYTTTETVTKTDYRQACIDAKIDPPLLKQSDPGVTVKFV